MSNHGLVLNFTLKVLIGATKSVTDKNFDSVAQILDEYVSHR